MTAQIKQAPVHVLADVDSTARVSQTAVMVLWGVDSSALVSQLVINVLTRPPRRRIIGITD